MNARRYMFVVRRYSFHVRAVLQRGGEFRSLSGHDGWGRQLSKRCVQSRKTLDSRLRGNDVGEYGNDGESNLLRPGRIHAAKVNGTVPFTFWT